MLNRKYAMFAAAAFAASPLLVKAAVITYSYDANDITVNGVVTPLGGTAAAPSLTVKPGSIVDIGVDVTITSNPNPASASNGNGAATTYDSAHTLKQPVTLGFNAFGLGFTDSNATYAAMNVSNGATINPIFTGASSTGTGVAGGVTAPTISGGFNVATASSSTASGLASIGYGAGTAAELFNSLEIDATTIGTSTFTVSDLPTTFAYNTYNSNGSTTTSKPVYKSTTAVAGVDTITDLAPLSIIVSSGTVVTGNKIISLTAAAPTSYGSQLGSITITGHNGSYVPGYLATASTTTGYVSVATFTPGTDGEAYALKLLVNGGTPTTAQLNQIVLDINASEVGGVSAGLVANSPYASVFNGYSIDLTVPTGSGVGATADLAFDFSQETNVAGVTVTGIAAVPEPATVAGVVMGAAGLLLGRRKRRVA